MRRLLILLSVTSAVLFPSLMQAQDIKDLTVTTKIDSIYVFGFDLKESRSAKGGIWNMRTGRPETPLNYTKAEKDTVDSVPVVKLYRQVVPGNHPLNGWEIWKRKADGWICIDGNMPGDSDAKSPCVR